MDAMGLPPSRLTGVLCEGLSRSSRSVGPQIDRFSTRFRQVFLGASAGADREIARGSKPVRVMRVQAGSPPASPDVPPACGGRTGDPAPAGAQFGWTVVLRHRRSGGAPVAPPRTD